MGITDVCISASFITVRAPPPSAQPPTTVLDESGQPTDLTVTASAQDMAEVIVPDNTIVYWSEPSLIDNPNQLHLYGGGVRFDVGWESNTTNITSSMLNSTKVILVGRESTSLWFQVSAESVAQEAATAVLKADFSVENALAVNGSEGQPTRELMLLTLSDVKLVLLPVTFHDQSHVSRLSDDIEYLSVLFTTKLSLHRYVLDI